MGTDFANNSLFTHPSHISLIEAEVLPTTYKLLPTFITFASASLAFYLYHYATPFLVATTKTSLGYNLYNFFNGKYYIEVLYNTYVIPASLGIGYIVSKQLDRGIVEMLFGYGLASGLRSSSEKVATLDNGTLPSYAIYFAFALVTLTLLLLCPLASLLPISSSDILTQIHTFIDIRLIVVLIFSILLVGLFFPFF